jgi:geranylgeranyl pyrophosphate synthase
LRPILVFVCGGVGGDPGAGGEPLCDTPAGAALVRAGVAVELLHMATLVHDDVLDRASLRRGRPTVFSSAGRAAATATGDLLFSRAFAELVATNDVDAVQALSSASSALARGELGAFGARVGVAFQIFDDVLDVAGPAERTGKRRGTDLLDGTVTLPLILARRRDRDLRDLDLREVVTDPAQAEAVCDRIALTGALGEARREALRHVAEAKAVLSDLKLPAGARRALDLVADGVVERYS